MVLESTPREYGRSRAAGGLVWVGFMELLIPRRNTDVKGGAYGSSSLEPLWTVGLDCSRMMIFAGCWVVYTRQTWMDLVV